ncbi:alpha/beta fold hydrolase [Archangium lansingense]|uniref:alpha/beta fold hydrolase n=1 Tax=Archangium lansingense TaxID=2995310 RepID=UPI003B7E06A4
MPTLVIATPEDPTTPASSSRHLAGLLPRSTLVTIDGMGHALPRAVLPRLSEALLNHLEAFPTRS